MINNSPHDKAKAAICELFKRGPEILGKGLRKLYPLGFSPQVMGLALAELTKDGTILLVQNGGIPLMETMLAVFVPNYPGDSIPLIAAKALRQYHGRDVPGKFIQIGDRLVDDMRGLTPPPVGPGQRRAFLEYGTTGKNREMFFIRSKDSETGEVFGHDHLMTAEQAVAMAKSILACLDKPIPFADPVGSPAPKDPSQN